MLDHLLAIRDRLRRERDRLASATTDGERALRAVWVAQAEKEEAAEMALLESRGVVVPDEGPGSPDLFVDEIAEMLGEVG